jgi:hypothetical protein
MNLNPAAVLNPVFNTLDALIQDYSVYPYLVFVWLALLVVAWVLSGGLKRKRPQGNSTKIIPASSRQGHTSNNYHHQSSAPRLIQLGTTTTKP